MARHTLCLELGTKPGLRLQTLGSVHFGFPENGRFLWRHLIYHITNHLHTHTQTEVGQFAAKDRKQGWLWQRVDTQITSKATIAPFGYLYWCATKLNVSVHSAPQAFTRRLLLPHSDHTQGCLPVHWTQRRGCPRWGSPPLNTASHTGVEHVYMSHGDNHVTVTWHQHTCIASAMSHA